ncbi:hypothetical protein BDZ94DRAFT_1232307 [Collybia nuda]|uniref:Uncharacterized protein n=1 Tax=Collybia nuda TaxID=64659 RepID=A0A9P5YE09_9AGAR|nr:hypothetical protein BDZ94DRAFT_1232307 [Collybia nuda]
MESQTTGFPPPLSPRLLWTSNPIYGIVHPTNCQICRHFMVHLAEASRADDDPSFNIALKERDFQRNSYYLNGVCEGRRLQREYSQTWVDQRDLYRAERDAAMETASQQFVDLCAVQEELEKLREEHRTLQDLFEEVVESGVRSISRTGSWSPSIDARVLEESLYDAHHHGFEDDFGADPWATLPDSLAQDVSQIPTPPESTAGSVPWRTAELPPLTDNAYLEDLPIIPANIPEPSGSYPSPTTSVIEVAPQFEEAPTFVEDHVEEAYVSPPSQTPTNVTELQALMNEAHAGNESALVRIKSMCTEAHATPRHRKTFIQQFLLCHWKGIPGRGRSVPWKYYIHQP